MIVYDSIKIFKRIFDTSLIFLTEMKRVLFPAPVKNIKNLIFSHLNCKQYFFFFLLKSLI